MGAGVMVDKEKQIEVISRILEETAFVFTDTISNAAIPDPGTWEVSGVSLDFSGEQSGQMRMWASHGFARSVAANMLGVSDDDPSAAEKGLDALKESLNIIVGNYLTTFFGEEPVFDLGLPQPVDPEKVADDVTSADAVWLSADDHPIMFITEIR